MSLFSKLSKNNDKVLYPWSQKKLGGSSSAIPRVGHAATALSAESIVIYGGIHKNSTKKDLFLIDTHNLSANSLSVSGDVPSPRISPVITSIHGHILMYGGKPFAQDEPYDGSFYVFKLHQKLWTRIHMNGYKPVERSGHTAVAHEGIMYVFGGQQEGNYFNDLFLFNTSTFNTQPRWEQLEYNNEGPETRCGHISGFFENKLYIFGGTDGQHLYNDIWSFDLHSCLWTRIEAKGYVPAPREACASAMVDDFIYIIGGRGKDGVELNDLYAYKIKSRRWFKFQNMGTSPSPRHGSTMTTIKDRLFVVGGENDLGKMEDAAFVHVLDSSKIKYPPDAPPQQQNEENKQYVRQQQSFDGPKEIPQSSSPQQQQQYSDNISTLHDVKSINGSTVSFEDDILGLKSRIQLLEQEKIDFEVQTKQFQLLAQEKSRLELQLKGKDNVINSLESETQELKAKISFTLTENQSLKLEKVTLEHQMNLLKQNMEHVLDKEKKTNKKLQREIMISKQKQRIYPQKASNSMAVHEGNTLNTDSDEHGDANNDINYDSEDSSDNNDINYDSPSEGEDTNNDLNYDGDRQSAK